MFFRKKKRPEPTPARDVAGLMVGSERSAAHLIATGEAAGSQLGGVPRVPADFRWPASQAGPLGFLAQVDLRELAEAHRVDWLPSSGSLLFFYDLERQPWGFDPRDRGSWAVVHLPGSAAGLAVAASPPSLSRKQRFAERRVRFKRIVTYPSYEREAVEKLALTETESDLLIDLGEAQFGGEPHHQIDGFPGPIQCDNMELECQLASSGINCGTPEAYQEPRAKALSSGAADWRLLLQVDTDDELGAMWGDGGRLYFWIRESDARAGSFDRAWLVLQRH